MTTNSTTAKDRVLRLPFGNGRHTPIADAISQTLGIPVR